MMNVTDLEALLARAIRFVGKLEDHSGPGASWTTTHGDGSTTTTEITKVKTPEELGDLFFTLAVAVWSIKDYLKDGAASLHTTPKAIEDFVNSDAYLPLCADLANLQKHGKLRTSRSKRSPSEVKLSYVISHNPQSGEPSPINYLSFGRDGLVHTNVADPDLVQLKFDVVNDDGELLCDGLDCLTNGLSAWETLYADLSSG